MSWQFSLVLEVNIISSFITYFADWILKIFLEGEQKIISGDKKVLLSWKIAQKKYNQCSIKAKLIYFTVILFKVLQFLPTAIGVKLKFVIWQFISGT